MIESVEHQLHTAIWAYHNAVQRRDGVESRLRRGELDAELYDRTLAASEAVLKARLALYRILIADGWTPPPPVLQDIHYDDSLLRQAAER